MPRKKADVNEEVMIRCAVLHYVEHRDQIAIARELDISQSQVSRLLRQARDQGLVQVRVEITAVSTARGKMEKSLKEQYGLREVVVVPAGSDRAGGEITLRSRLGKATAQWIDRTVKDSVHLGITWGEELFVCAEALAKPQHPIHVYPLVAYAVPSERRVSMHQGFTIRDVLMSKSSLVSGYAFASPPIARREAVGRFQRYREALDVLDIVVATAHYLLPGSLFHGFLDEMKVTPAEIVEAGVVGEFAGYPLTARGAPVRRDLFRKFYDRAALPLPFWRLRRVRQIYGSAVPCVVLTAGGRHNAPIIRAVLAARLCDVLITDMDAALALVDP